jgi:hypothetical protein
METYCINSSDEQISDDNSEDDKNQVNDNADSNG